MFSLFFLIVIFSLDTLVWLTLRVAYKTQPEKRKRILRWHIFLTLGFVALLVLYRVSIEYQILSRASRQTIALIFVWIYLTKVLSMLIFALTWIVRKSYKTIAGKAVGKPADSPAPSITRAQFLERVSLATGGVSLGLGFWGTNFSLYDYQVRHVTLHLPTLPTAFDGLRLAQVSDIHAGSLANKLAVKGGLERILSEKPDLICFTGDLVNYDSTELAGFEHLFASLKAPLGVFSCLGNHDYGDYRAWNSPTEKAKNLQTLLHAQQKFGWKPLVDSHTYLEAGKDKIALIGVGNWSKISRFPRYGNLQKAYENINPEATTQILLSHDPTHWDAQVRPQTPNISLMLAGHTHGMQMGIEWGSLRVSPAQLLFEQWAGLYQKGSQYLYVNRGFGYSDALPVRLGILPEITIFTLKKGEA